MALLAAGVHGAGGAAHALRSRSLPVRSSGARRILRCRPASSLGGGRNIDADTSFSTDPEDVDGFTRETTQVVERSLTARAVQKVLVQLGTLDAYSAQWLHAYCATHPPLEGNPFILRLMAERPSTSMDPYSGATHYVFPAELANRVLAIRADLAQKVARHLAGQVQADNWAILREHLEAHTYVSGTHNEASARPTFRQPQLRTRRTQYNPYS